MAFVIAEPCVDVKDSACVDVCPVECIYEGEDQYYIHPDDCIDCGLCDPECPVEAIFIEDAVPDQWLAYIEKNRAFFDDENDANAEKPQKNRQDAAVP